MKIIKLLIILLPLFFIQGCEEERNQPLFEGDTPDAIKEYSVENLSGAAEITFKLNDPRTAYVKAVYTLKNGLTREAKASKFDNRILVEGFSEVKSYSVALYAVGRNEKESSPLMITVNPKKPPFQEVVQNLTLTPDWGGGKLQGNNATNAKLLIGVIKKNQTTGQWENVEVFFTEGKSFLFNYRKQSPVETVYGVYARDQYQNYSDTILHTFAPWEENVLPLSNTTAAHFIELPGDAKAQAAYPLRNIFNGVFGSWTTGYYSSAAPFPQFITIDLLANYELSRFKYFQNNNLYYQSANAKHIRIWGNTTPNTDYSTWTLLGEWDNWRPSGRPATTGNPGLTELDILKADEGNDFDFPLGIPAVRYIRIEAVSTWEPRTQVYYPELIFWGRKSN